MNRLYTILFLLLFALPASAQTTGPEVTNWIVNRTEAMGYGGLPSNVQAVQYSSANVYVTCTCIPGYDIGPWAGNPNVPKNQNFLFQITRTPTVNTGTKTATPLGHVGVWTNGVSIFNAKDARSYNNAGVWNQNAIVVEGSSFDACIGHPAPNGEYHHHLNPVCLYDDKDSTHHSPIIGYAFDGFPIYGAYGFAKTDGTGGIRRMNSSYRMRAITDRTTLPDGTALSSSQDGPALSTQYPLGYYIEDFEYIAGLGDLDQYNGRFCVTPEYPAGTYAYFVTIDSARTATYPYTVGPSYYGVVTAGDTGPGSGHVTISESVLTYAPSSGSVGEAADSSLFSLYPNPATDYVTVSYASTNDYLSHIVIRDVRGSLVLAKDMTSPGLVLPLVDIPEGSYFVTIFTTSGKKLTKRFVR